jgi:hypothetical protein
MSHKIDTYTELKQQIHDDLRTQHPEWVKPDGDCPTCDSYESRLAQLLNRLQITLGRDEHEQILGALVLDDHTQTAC